jgi:cobalamin biosynthesis protein CobT
MAEEKKGITVKIDADLHGEVKAYVEAQGLTMAEFVSKALDDELHPKMTITGGTTMEKMRTMAFQVPEDLFQKIKDYLNRNHMTQKEFVIGLITKEIDRDLSARQEAAEAAVSADEQDSEEYGEPENNELSEDSDEEFEDDEEDEHDEDEDEDSEYDDDEDEDYDDEEDEDAEFDEDEEYDEAEDEDPDEEADEDEDTAEAEEPVME